MNVRCCFNDTVVKETRNYLQEMAAKIDTEQGRRIYPRRTAIVEPVFANSRTHKEVIIEVIKK